MIRLDPAVLFLAVILITASIKDVISFRIPNWLTYPALAMGISYLSFMKGYEGFLFSVAGAMTGFGLLIIPYIIGGSGAGDVKLLGVVGSFLGYKSVFSVFILSCILGGVYALFLLASKGLLIGTLKRYGIILRTFIITRQFMYIAPSQKERQMKIRYGLAIALGTFLHLGLAA
jgi:prepilin peptidase CpaA